MLTEQNFSFGELRPQSVIVFINFTEVFPLYLRIHKRKIVIVLLYGVGHLIEGAK